MPEFFTHAHIATNEPRPLHGVVKVISGAQQAGEMAMIDFIRFFNEIGLPEEGRAEIHQDLRSTEAVTVVAIQNRNRGAEPILGVLSGQITNTNHPKQLELTFVGIDTPKLDSEDIAQTFDALYDQARQMGCTRVVCTPAPEHASSMASVLAGYKKTQVDSGVVFEKEL